MKAIAILLLLAVSNADNVHQYNMMPEDNVNGTGQLGICYGSNTNWMNYPYAAALRYTSGSACCSATIISTDPAILVSAAHCNGCTGQVRIGCSNPLNCDGGSYSISQFIQNPSYGSPTQFSNDIAVVLLNGPITEAATALNIPSVEPTLGSVRLVGYGIDQSGGIPSVLQTMESPVIEQQQCQDIMSNALGGGTYVDHTMICIRGGSAGQENIGTMCSGDSGGPMENAGFLYGANSWVLQGSGQGCNSCNCCPGYPQVAANVAWAAPWINSIVNAWKKGDFNYTYSEA